MILLLCMTPKIQIMYLYMVLQQLVSFIGFVCMTCHRLCIDLVVS